MSQAPENYPGDQEDWNHDVPKNLDQLFKNIKDTKLWRDILEEAKTNHALQEALDRAILIYHMSKRDG